MPVKLIPSPNYKNDRIKIMDSIVHYALQTGNDAVPILKFFRNEERDLQKRIQISPLSAGINCPKPTKKGTSNSGKYVILYTYLPPDASTNPEITQVNLDSILPTASYAFNKLMDGLIQADLDN
jgi:hypothetical protein